MKNSFILYTEYEDKLKILTDEQLGKLLRAVFQYESIGNIEMELEPIVQLAFGFISGDLDRANQKYTESIESGKKGGAPGGNTNAKKATSENENNPKQPKTRVEEKKQGSEEKNNPKQGLEKKNNLNVDVNVDVNVNDNDTSSTPPNPQMGGMNERKPSGESLPVETADGTGISPVNPSTTRKRSFEEFWCAYPKKVGKGAAEKAYQRIPITEELHKKMLSAVEISSKSDQWNRDNGQYIPNPATWLNQRRWEDELHGADAIISGNQRIRYDEASGNEVSPTKLGTWL